MASGRSLLIVAPSLQPNDNNHHHHYNITQHLIKITAARKFKVFATTLTEERNLVIGNVERDSAVAAGVTPIGALRPLGPRQDIEPHGQRTTDWLTVTPHCYYRRLPKALPSKPSHIIAIGYEYAWAALNIKDAFFDEASIVVVSGEMRDEGGQTDFDWMDEVDTVVATEMSVYDAGKEKTKGKKACRHVFIPLTDITLLNLGIEHKAVDVTYGNMGALTCACRQLRQLSLTPTSPTSSTLASPATLTAPKPKVINVEWHKSINSEVEKFHNDFARYPEAAIKKMRAEFESMMKIIEGRLREMDLCERFEYTGSAYEKVMVDANDIEFDLMIIMSKGHDISHEPIKNGPEGFFLLQPKDPEESEYGKYRLSPSEPVIVPEKVVNQFFGTLQKILNDKGYNFTSKLRKHGPAIQLDVYTDKTKKDKMFSVDIVPAFQISSAKEEDLMLFVAKPYSGNDKMYAWRRSFSVEEKKEFKNIDTDNGCRRMCVRIMKVLTKPRSQAGKKGTQDTSMNNVTSFMIKNAVFHVNRQNPRMDWNQKKIGQRLLLILETMSGFFETGFFPHFFLKDVNLIRDMKEDLRMNLTTRLLRLCNSEVEFRKAINAPVTA